MWRSYSSLRPVVVSFLGTNIDYHRPHKLLCGRRRGSPEMKKSWEVFVLNHVAESSRQESELALQLIFGRLLKRLLL